VCAARAEQVRDKFAELTNRLGKLLGSSQAALPNQRRDEL
jgi:hypothetical protein